MKKLLFVLLFLFILICFAGFFIWQGVYLPKNSNLTEDKLFLVEKGQNLSQIGENLEKQGLIRNRFLFDFYVISKGKTKQLQAGPYLLKPSMNIVEIANKIISGEVHKIKITIPEGFNLKQISELLQEKKLTEESIEKLRVGEFKSEFDFLKDAPDENNLEGFLFPDTYLFNGTESDKEIVKKFLENFDKKITSDLRNEVEGQGKTIFEIVVMASILEKEVQTKEDKELVSGIFWKRIKEGMPLDSCATIAYILEKSTWSFDEMRQEIAKAKEIDSPYNTYKYLGLPPGPICNPGIDSIIAAIYPKSNDYWYYLSTPEGKTIFSRTLEEHNIAKAKYLW